MRSKATTVEQYLREQTADRRKVLEVIRAVILKNLDQGFEEGMQYGMIGYYVPHRIFPDGYHCDPEQPLPFAGLASQKNHISICIMSLYAGDPENRFRKAWAATGRKLDMGKCCIRFRKLEDCALDLIGAEFRRMTVSAYVNQYVANRSGGASKSASPSSAAAKKAIRKSAGAAKPLKVAAKSATKKVSKKKS
ncbi:MAG: DUF1801 domain-containing protein [Planctomycetota bacterium]